MAQTLLPLKLTPPPARSGVLLRPDLQSLLSEVRLHPLTLLIAPAGYGKTTLLSQWIQELTRTGAAVSWLSLDNSERDPALFLAYIIRAFQGMFPDIGTDAWRILHSAANLERDWPLVAGSLCGDLQRKVQTSTFLILDDLHQVSDSAVIGQVLGYLVRAAPLALHIVMSSRRVPTFAPLSRFRAEGRLVEVLQRDLHLASNEVRQILAMQDVELSDSDLALLLERTEGWALSVQLAARALAGQPFERRSAFVTQLGGSQEQLISYLSTEVLSDLPPDLLEFLRMAAIPAYFSGPLLTEVLQREEIDYLLKRAQALGLPLVPIDEHGDRLHFHPLWRELLLRGLPEIVDQDTLQVLHRRFGRFFESHGDLEAALDHYVSAGDTVNLARALRERGWPLLRSPRRDAMRRWLEQIPIAALEADPNLLHMWGASQVSAEPQSAMLDIERASELYRQGGQFEQELSSLADLATLLTWQVNSSKLSAVCVRAIRAANHVNDTWSRGATLVCVVTMLAVKGRQMAALRVARQASAKPLNPTWRWLLAMSVAEMSCQLGRPIEALTTIDEALQLPQLDHDDRLRQSLLSLRGVALFEQGQIAEGMQLTNQAHQHLSDYYRGGIAGFSAARLAQLLMFQGRVDEATTAIAQARTAFHDLGASAPLVHLQALEVYGQMLRGQTSNACAMVGSVLRRLREYDNSAADVRMWLLLALVLGEGGETARALDLAHETAGLMQSRGYRLFLASAWLYGAYLAGKTGDTERHYDLLSAGWNLVANDNYRYLPMLSPTVICDVALAALREGLTPQAVGHVLRRQAPEQAVELLLELIADPSAKLRANATRILGDLGAATAYSALRQLVKDRDTSVRQAAEDALSRLVYRPPYSLRIRTLGGFTIWRGDQEIRDRDWRSSKARQIFQLLLTERGRNVPREQILETLWPEMEPDMGSNNLRVTLNRLSKALEPERPDGAPPTYTSQQGETFTFNLNSDHWLDASEFDKLVAEGQRADHAGQRQVAIAAFRRAIQLYNGPYLPDSLYEDWTVIERERLAMLFSDAAIRLGSLLLDEGQAHEAIGMGWRVLEADQTNEAAYRLLMRAHAYLGERSTALRLYARCVHVLKQELGVEPMVETEALYQTLRDIR
jgi:ATP/maltotriose-dependent transcriptional regulator MalT/DNA-binding SARP family transcriptional activator